LSDNSLVDGFALIFVDDLLCDVENVQHSLGVVNVVTVEHVKCDLTHLWDSALEVSSSLDKVNSGLG